MCLPNRSQSPRNSSRSVSPSDRYYRSQSFPIAPTPPPPSDPIPLGEIAANIQTNILKVADVIGETVPFDELRKILTPPSLGLSGVGFGLGGEDPDNKGSDSRPSSQISSPTIFSALSQMVEQKTPAQEIPNPALATPANSFLSRSKEEVTAFASSQSPSSVSSLQYHSSSRVRVTPSQSPSASSPLQHRHQAQQSPLSRSGDKNAFALDQTPSGVEHVTSDMPSVTDTFPPAEVKTVEEVTTAQETVFQQEFPAATVAPKLIEPNEPESNVAISSLEPNILAQPEPVVVDLPAKNDEKTSVTNDVPKTATPEAPTLSAKPSPKEELIRETETLYSTLEPALFLPEGYTLSLQKSLPRI